MKTNDWESLFYAKYPLQRNHILKSSRNLVYLQDGCYLALLIYCIQIFCDSWLDGRFSSRQLARPNEPSAVACRYISKEQSCHKIAKPRFYTVTKSQTQLPGLRYKVNKTYSNSLTKNPTFKSIFRGDAWKPQDYQQTDAYVFPLVFNMNYFFVVLYFQINYALFHNTYNNKIRSVTVIL